MQIGKITLLSTIAAQHFTGIIAQNAAGELNLNVASAGLADTVDCRVKSIRIISVENLSYELQLYRTDQFGHLTDPDQDFFAGWVLFATTDAKQLGASGLWHYYLEDLDIPYDDKDRSSELHLALIPRSAGKQAGAAGSLRIELCVEETKGY